MNMQCVQRDFTPTIDIEQTFIFILWLEAAEVVDCVQSGASNITFNVNWLLSVFFFFLNCKVCIFSSSQAGCYTSDQCKGFIFFHTPSFTEAAISYCLVNHRNKAMT